MIIFTWRSDRSQFSCVFEKVSFQLGKNVLSVGVLSQGGTVRPDLVHERFALVGLGHVNHLLDHVIRVLVLHHRVQGTGSIAKRSSIYISYIISKILLMMTGLLLFGDIEIGVI